jgi:hypothetical protein
MPDQVRHDAFAYLIAGLIKNRLSTGTAHGSSAIVSSGFIVQVLKFHKPFEFLDNLNLEP